MKPLLRAAAVGAMILFIAPALPAATYLVPTDARMVAASDDVVVATAIASVAMRNARGGIVTAYTLRVDETWKGHRRPGEHLVLTELGGVLGGRASLVSGAPIYAPGRQYLVFTETNRDGDPVTLGMSLGRFALVRDGDRLLAVRDAIHGFDQNLEPYTDSARDLHAFRDYVRALVAQRPAEPAYFVQWSGGLSARRPLVVTTNFSPGTYLMVSGTAC